MLDKNPAFRVAFFVSQHKKVGSQHLPISVGGKFYYNVHKNLG